MNSITTLAACPSADLFQSASVDIPNTTWERTSLGPTRLIYFPGTNRDSLLLTAPQSRLRSFGDRAFEHAAPRLWNALPICLRSANTLDSFNKSLNTFLVMCFNIVLLTLYGLDLSLNICFIVFTYLLLFLVILFFIADPKMDFY